MFCAAQRSKGSRPNRSPENVLVNARAEKAILANQPAAAI
jgi:hypothetical protein